MRRVLSYGLAPEGEFRRSNVETAPATADLTKLQLIPSPADGRLSYDVRTTVVQLVYSNSCIPTLSSRIATIGAQCTRSGAAASLKFCTRADCPDSSCHPRHRRVTRLPDALLMWVIAPQSAARDITSSASFLQRTRLERRHLGLEERVWQVASSRGRGGWTRLCQGIVGGYGRRRNRPCQDAVPNRTVA